ncbi:MAG TPA: hypothetical protein DHU96_18295 [Actinobacteria bacterium]|nr:hypothetical protein [Actinomycetota bacterium]
MVVLASTCCSSVSFAWAAHRVRTGPGDLDRTLTQGAAQCSGGSPQVSSPPTPPRASSSPAPRSAGARTPAGPLARIQPGDLLFSAGADGTNPGHVVMYLGGGLVIQAPQTGQDVQVQAPRPASTSRSTPSTWPESSLPPAPRTCPTTPDPPGGPRCPSPSPSCAPARPDLMTAAAALGMGRTKAYELARCGQFPCRVIRIGEVYRVPAGLLELLSITPEDPHSQTPAGHRT